ncbi:MAG: hypothetical protein IJE78_13450 [Bacteroidaceae bacterium]|nr:hypothetical protein [Bacteroidaceae bacterium]
MKKESISTYIIALLTLSSLWFPMQANAQEDKEQAEEKTTETPFYQGTMVGVDVFGFINKVLSSDITTTEASIEVNLKNRFFPVVEIGYGSIDTMDEETGIHFKTSAPFFRAGLNYNVFYQKPHLPGYLTVGLRYGFSSFSYDIQAPDLVDPNWGHISVPFSYEGLKTKAGWLELVLGLKTNVYKDFYMGFTIRYRSRLSMTKHENSEPYYIPGYGKGKPNNFGITYNLIYKLPF